MSTHRFAKAGVAALFVLGLLGLPAGSQAAATPSTTTFSGQATAVKGSIAAVPELGSLLPCTPPSTPPSSNFCIVDTGPLSATQAVQGGANEASLLCYPSGTNCLITSPAGDPTSGAVSARALHGAGHTWSPRR